MQVDFKTELKKEWFILTPSLAHGMLEPQNVLSYNDSQTIELIDNEEDYLIRCWELDIDVSGMEIK